MIRMGPVAKRLTNGSIGRAVVEYDCGRIGLVDLDPAYWSMMEVEEWAVGRIVCDTERP